MRMRNRRPTVLVAAGYAFVATVAGLFHNHVRHKGVGCGSPDRSCAIAWNGSSACRYDTHDGCRHDTHHNGHHGPSDPIQCPADDSNCLVCQFLAQKPAPVADVAPVASFLLLHEVAVIGSSRSISGVFAAWHSRAPPALA